MQQGDIAAEMERARVDFHHLLDNATSAELRAGTDGTKWTNEQLLFHMLFGYLLVNNLLILVKAFTRLPRRVSKAFAATLDAATRPFHVVNYLGSKAAARVYNRRRMAAKLRRVTRSLERRMRRETAAAMARGMSFPDRWDPFFTPWMSLAEVYAYPIEHFDFHATQLSLGGGQPQETRARKTGRKTL